MPLKVKIKFDQRLELIGRKQTKSSRVGVFRYGSILGFLLSLFSIIYPRKAPLTRSSCTDFTLKNYVQQHFGAELDWNVQIFWQIAQAKTPIITDTRKPGNVTQLKFKPGFDKKKTLLKKKQFKFSKKNFFDDKNKKFRKHFLFCFVFFFLSQKRIQRKQKFWNFKTLLIFHRSKVWFFFFKRTRQELSLPSIHLICGLYHKRHYFRKLYSTYGV